MIDDINVELRHLEAMIDQSFKTASRFLTADDIAEVQRGFQVTLQRSKTAGEVKFIKEWEQNDSSSRNFDGYGWKPNTKAKKTLAKALWSLAMAFGHIHTGYRIFSKVRASHVSPDGLMGGRGYIKPIREMRAKLAEAVEILSDVTDTLHDDLNGPQWEHRAEADTQKLLAEADQVMQNPDQVDEVEESSTVADDVAAEADSAPDTSIDASDDAPDTTSEPDTSDTPKQAFTKRIARRVARRFMGVDEPGADPSNWPSHYFTRERQLAPTTDPDRDLPINNWSGSFMSDELPLSDRFVEDVERVPTYGVGPRDDGTNPRTF
jgi:hypothetical protein